MEKSTNRLVNMVDCKTILAITIGRLYLESNLNFNYLFWFFEKFRTPYTIQNLFYDTVLIDCAGSLALS